MFLSFNIRICSVLPIVKWHSACSNNFSIDDKEFDKLLKLPRGETIERLKVLAEFASDISLEYLLIIKYTLKELENDDDLFDEYFNYSLNSNISNRVDSVRDRGVYGHDELIRFRLAYLAKKSLSWKSEDDVGVDTYAGDDRLNFLYLKNPKDIWDAYKKISKKWLDKVLPSEKESFNSLLPEVYEYEEYWENENDDNKDEAVDETREVAEAERLLFRNDVLGYFKGVKILLITLLCLVLILVIK